VEKREEFLIFGSPLIEEAAIEEVVDCLRSGWIGTGPRVNQFERMLEAYLGVGHVRCLASCTAALMLALRVQGIGPGDEVLVPTMTFVACANAILHAGATPVFIDCEPGTGLIDLPAAEAALTDRTRALMIVHLAGRPVDLDQVNGLRDRNDLILVEDAAHAIGATWQGARIGNHGNLTAYSFYVTKNITTGEGGALATDDADIAAEVERLALHGLSLGAWQRFSDSGFRHYDCVSPGYKFNMTDLQAAIGLHQLPQLDGWIERRRELWQHYDDLLDGLPLELPPPSDSRGTHARHLYSVLISPNAGVDRDDVLAHLHSRGIGAGVHYRAIHLHPYYRDRFALEPEQFPVATSMSERTLSLPLSPKVTERDQEDVARALRGVLLPTPHAG
jgi:dTDP-4-amino-4,6-dideoxygalactose transaminase